jgi:anti-sigma B factor antagonist
MSYTHKTIVGVDVIELEESIDLYSVPELKKFCKDLLKKGSKNLVLGMEKLTYMDSSGLGMLINLGFECGEQGIGLKLAALSPDIDKLFTLTKIHEKFTICGTVNEAIRSFG